MLARMPGDAWQRFANLRALYGFMWAYPGKKLMFMGCELAQPTEWADGGELPWCLEGTPAHAGVQRLVRDLNLTYRAHAALHEQDVQPKGFEWIAHGDAAQSVVSFVRWAVDGRCVVVVCNFTPVPRSGYRVGVPYAGTWTEVFNTDATVYGGSGVGSVAGPTEPLSAHQYAQSLNLTLPPLACVMLVPTSVE
jgi:1,4-alpha-glucan branching enzyme